MKKTTLLAFCMALAAIINADREMMTERCSGTVAIVPSYDDMPSTPGTVILKRGTNGFSEWKHVTVKLNPDGYIRWWCHSEGEGWTKERSRCGNRSTKIRARLGAWRELQIECLGN
jgi:hypothetical protein